MQFIAGLDGVVTHAHSQKLLGGFYRAASDSTRPTAILLHGVPGVEKNLDLAHTLRTVGWNCLYFHYRGCWGSQGVYSFTALVDDMRAATEWVLQQPTVDAERLALIGSSMGGGYVTLAAGAAGPCFKTLVPICPLVDPTTRSLALEMAEGFATMLNGVSGPELKAQWDSLPPVLTFADRLAGRSLLLVTGDQDEMFPPEHYQPLVNCVPDLRWERFPDADHAFSTCRQRLVATIANWLLATV